MNFDQLMKSGQLYASPPEGVDQAVAAKLARCQDLLYDFNHTRFTQLDRRKALLRELFAETRGDFYVEPPLYANWGCNVHIGEGFYANFHLTLVDDADIYFGDHVMVAPNVTVATAAHPIAPELREKLIQYNLPVHVGNRVWIGAGAVILPGVTIGDNSVIGAGSIVTRDIPADVVAVGNPCRVLRPITQRDREFFRGDRPIDPQLFE